MEIPNLIFVPKNPEGPKPGIFVDKIFFNTKGPGLAKCGVSFRVQDEHGEECWDMFVTSAKRVLKKLRRRILEAESLNRIGH